MEDRAKFALIGLFTFAVVAAAFVFIYWLHNAGGSKETRPYLVVFEGSVSELEQNELVKNYYLGTTS